MKVLVVMLLVVGIFSLSGFPQQALGYLDCEDDDIYGLQGTAERPCGWGGAGRALLRLLPLREGEDQLGLRLRERGHPRHEKYISMKKLAYVAGYCGAPLKPGTKCGSYQVPQRP